MLHTRNKIKSIITDHLYQYPPAVPSDPTQAVTRYMELFGDIDALQNRKQPVLVAIEGSCCAGKSTLARLFQQIYGCPVISMDDFFLPSQLRTAQRFSEPGGNIHYERFVQEISEPLQQNIPFFYRAFDCSTMDYAPDLRFAAPGPITVIEGSYSLHPRLAIVYDYKIFMHISAPLQQERIIKRNGVQAYQSFVQKWIPLENQYFETWDIRHCCDTVLG